MTNDYRRAGMARRAVLALSCASWIALTGRSAAARAAGVEELIQKDGCAACHQTDDKLVGPSFRAIAAKYRSKSGAAAHLFDVIRSGTDEPIWGNVPMPQNPPEKVPDADLQRILEFVLSL